MTEPTELSTDAVQSEITSPETAPAAIADPESEEIASQGWRRWIWLPLLLIVVWVFNNDGDTDALRERFDFASLLAGWLLAGAAMIVVFVWALCKILDKVPKPFDD